jgi:hypothetical protein
MITEREIELAGPCEKLCNFSTNSFISGVARYIAKRLSKRESAYADEIILTVSLCVSELRKGKDGFTGEPINDRTITGLDEGAYNIFTLLWHTRIIKEIFPPEDALQIFAVLDEVNREVEAHVRKDHALP